MSIYKVWIEIFLRNYLKFILFAMPFIIAYIPILSEILNLKSPYIIALFYGPVFLSIIWIKNVLKFYTNKIYLVMILISVISLCWSIDFNKGMTNIFLLSSALVISYLLFFYNYRKMWAYFSWGMLLFTILLKWKVLYFFLDTYNFGGDRLGYIEGQFATDPNFIGMFLGIAIIYFITELILHFNKGITKLYLYIHFAIVILLLYFLFITLSRTITLAFVIAFFLLFVRLVIKHTENVKILIRNSIVSVVMAVAFILIILNSPLATRFSGLFHDDRMDIWAIIWNLIGRFDLYSFVGYGMGSSDIIIGKYFYGAVKSSDGIYRFSAHNLYFDWLLQTGLISFIALLFIIGYAIYYSWKALDRNTIDSLLLGIFFLLCSFGINTFGHYSWPVIAGLFISTLLNKEFKQKGLKR